MAIKSTATTFRSVSSKTSSLATASQLQAVNVTIPSAVTLTEKVSTADIVNASNILNGSQIQSILPGQSPAAKPGSGGSTGGLLNTIENKGGIDEAALIRSYPDASGCSGSCQPSSRSNPLMSCDRAARPSAMDQKPSSRSAFMAMLLSVAMI